MRGREGRSKLSRYRFSVNGYRGKESQPSTSAIGNQPSDKGRPVRHSGQARSARSGQAAARGRFVGIGTGDLALGQGYQKEGAVSKGQGGDDAKLRVIGYLFSVSGVQASRLRLYKQSAITG
jgi:hypothetical protein